MTPTYKLNLGVLCLFAGSGVQSLRGQSTPAPIAVDPSVVAQIRTQAESNTESSVNKAYHLIEQLDAQSDPEQRAQLQQQLTGWVLQQLNAPQTQMETHWTDTPTTRSFACHVAGLLHIEAAIPLLIRLLKPLPGQSPDRFSDGAYIGPTYDGWSLPSPAVSALIKMGHPAEAALRKELPLADAAYAKAKQDVALSRPSREAVEAFANEGTKAASIRYILEHIDSTPAPK